MTTGELLHKIASRAEYIQQVASAASYDRMDEGSSVTNDPVLVDILRQLDDISDGINEYYNWEGEE